MSTELDCLLANLLERKKISAAEVARRIRIAPKQLSLWRKGKAPIPDDRAVPLAAELGVTPFDIKPDFNSAVFDGIPDPDEREELRLHMKRVFRNKVAVMPPPIQAAPVQSAPIATKKVSRNNRTK